MKDSKLWAVIPAYNEERHIASVLEETKRYVQNIVVVDDGSSDRTYDLAVAADVHVLRNIVNMGKGSTLRTGCEYALMNGAESIVALDSDGQHKPSEILLLVDALHGADIVFGCRKLTSDMPAILKFGNWFITNSVRLLFGIAIQDTQSGFRAFTADAYRRIRWKASDYSVESEMIANAGKQGLKYREVTISTIYNDKYKGTTVIDGIKIVFNMLLWRMRI